MFIPISDDNSDRTLTPWCTYAFVAMNVFFFAVMQRGGEDIQFTSAGWERSATRTRRAASPTGRTSAASWRVPR